MFDFASKLTKKERFLLRTAFFLRLLKRIVKFRARVRLQANQLKRFESVKRTELAAKDVEIVRLNKLIETQTRRFEIELMESRDRILEMRGSYGIRYAQTKEEDREIKLKAEKYAPAKPKDPLARLSSDERQAYDERYQNHVGFCHADGIFDDARIRELWKLHEGEEIQQISIEMGSYQQSE